jgi:hypothetical protein
MRLPDCLLWNEMQIQPQAPVGLPISQLLSNLLAIVCDTDTRFSAVVLTNAPFHSRQAPERYSELSMRFSHYLEFH